MTEQVVWPDHIKDALGAMKTPRPLAALVELLSGTDVDVEAMLEHLLTTKGDDQGLVQFRISLTRWDAEEAAEWARLDGAIAPAGSPQRRLRMLELLGFDSSYAGRILDIVPISVDESVIIAKDFEPWYRDERQARSSMYWDHYLNYLSEIRGWPASSVQSLDATTTQVVERISDPRRLEARQTKGLVVGYVQSGKTANFTGVAAKAIDAGYRLVIVLTGTIEVLRAQTQLRLDKELVGRENILDGLDERDPLIAKDLDYQQDEDWIADRFMRHGDDLEQGLAPRIRRLTTHRSDYKALKHGQTQLRYGGLDRTKPLNHPDNLLRADAHIAVVKKNPASLRKLIQDIKPFRGRSELPVLIIDDESDQASVDTTNPNQYGAKSAEGRKRTTINQLLSSFLKLLPRAQYVGYTATPFANVFIDPDDDSDLFPSHFILSLQRPPGYLGVADFHDLDSRYDEDGPTVATSNELAFVRALIADPGTDPASRFDELRSAVDAFVLAGAVKLFRAAATGRRYRHHTMLVHESVKKIHHADAAEDVRHLWREGAFTAPEGLSRLRHLWLHDFEKVCLARHGGEPVPDSFEALRPFVAETVLKLSEGRDPVAVMNSDKEVAAAQRSVDFESDDVWRILVGGTQLSRGFTIEGLTISYFRRQSMQADTLMQAGRWFGFRSGYRDLVRLYIRRDPSVDLYKAFEALLLDEESFRKELRQYAVLREDGRPAVEPWQVPPLVSQHLPWLKPTARNKMWNARIDEKGSGGRTMDFYHHPARTNLDRRHNLEKVGLPLLRKATREGTLRFALVNDKGSLDVRVGRMQAQEFLELLEPGEGMRWHQQHAPNFVPTLKFLRSATDAGRITGWNVVWPQAQKSGPTQTDFFPAPVPVAGRSLRQGRTDFVGSDRKHRDVAERLAGTGTNDLLEDPLRDELRRQDPETTGVILAYLAKDTTQDVPVTGDSWQDHLVLFSLVVPPTAVADRSNRIRWVVQRRDLEGVAAVSVSPL